MIRPLIVEVWEQWDAAVRPGKYMECRPLHGVGLTLGRVRMDSCRLSESRPASEPRDRHSWQHAVRGNEFKSSNPRRLCAGDRGQFLDEPSRDIFVVLVVPGGGRAFSSSFAPIDLGPGPSVFGA